MYVNDLKVYVMKDEIKKRLRVFCGYMFFLFGWTDVIGSTLPW